MPAWPARPRKASTRRWASPGSRPNCARTPAKSKPRSRDAFPSWWNCATSAATSTCTPPRPMAAPPWRKWPRRRASAATNTSPSPTTPSPEIGTYLRSVARDHGDGWRLPGGEEQLDLWGLKPGETRDFVRARLCDFSLRCFEEPLRLPANRKPSIPSTFVSSVAEGYPARPFFAPFSAKARALGWEVAELKTGREFHVEPPGPRP